VEFYLYAQYKSHDEETLGLMDEALKHFHTFKHVFRQFRVTKKVTNQGKECRKVLMEQQGTAMQGKRVPSRKGCARSGRHLSTLKWLSTMRKVVISTFPRYISCFILGSRYDTMDLSSNGLLRQKKVHTVLN